VKLCGLGVTRPFYLRGGVFLRAIQALLGDRLLDSFAEVFVALGSSPRSSAGWVSFFSPLLVTTPSAFGKTFESH